MRTVRPVVHLELHSPDREAAGNLYSELCDWRSRAVGSNGSGYTGFSLGPDLGGGIVECGTDRAIWLPYVEVADVEATTERARGLGARVLLEPREGPAGWRSVVRSDAGGEVAFWQVRAPKR
jgi:predicted enzyme related to lactoylglutathione lyase